MLHADSIDSEKRETVGIPTKDILSVPLESGDESEDEKKVYQVFTHDRGENAGDYFYQIAFKIEDPKPGTELWIGEKLLVSYEGFWYEKTEYRKKKENDIYQWELRKDPSVDSITTAGVFDVVARVEGKDETAITVHVIPSSISSLDYKMMLNDLIELHESLVRKDTSTVGIGSWQEMDLKLIEDIIRCVKQIQKLPPESMKKEYQKLPVDKVHRFDNRVLRDYVRNGGVGKTMAVVYQGDADTYENRVIKKLLRCVSERISYEASYEASIVTCYDYSSIGGHMVQRDNGLESAEIYCGNICNDKKTDDYDCIWISDQPIRKITDKNGCSKYKEVDTQKSTFLKVEEDFEKNKFSIKILREVNGTPKPYILVTKKAEEALYWLEILCESQRNGSRGFSIEYLKEKCRNSENKGLEYEICGIKYIDEKYAKCKKKEYSCDEFYEKLEYVLAKYPECIELEKESRYFRYKSDIEDRVKEGFDKKIEGAKSRIQETGIAIKSILDSRWFSQIQGNKVCFPVRMTPKFSKNRYYSKLYRLLTEVLERHPYMAAEFDVNAFGVHDTQHIYEQWVFVKLLMHFKKIGFEFENAEGQKAVRDNFLAYIQKKGKASGYAVDLKKENIRISLGYEQEWKIGGKKRRPDFFLIVKHEGYNHIYFFDAKYNTFSENSDGRKGYNIYKMIGEVAIKKYYHKVEKKGDNGTYRVMGSYIICPEIDMPKEKDEAALFFGATEGINGKNRLTSVVDEIKLESADANDFRREKAYPAHRYGAIRLTPQNDWELTALIQMIFEYVETKAEKNQDNHQVCWRCGSTEMDRLELNTEAGFDKYYVTCKNPGCQVFRVENHCLKYKCNKAIIKYHNRNYHQRTGNTEGNKWHFICPMCGNGNKSWQRSKTLVNVNE